PGRSGALGGRQASRAPPGRFHGLIGHPGVSLAALGSLPATFSRPAGTLPLNPFAGEPRHIPFPKNQSLCGVDSLSILRRLRKGRKSLLAIAVSVCCIAMVPADTRRAPTRLMTMRQFKFGF